MREGSVRVGLGWWLVVKCFFKKGGVGGAGKRAGGRAKRMCHRTGKVQGYSLEHCRRILEWRSLAKLCREPTMLHPKVSHELKKGKTDNCYTEEPTKAAAALRGAGAKEQRQTQEAAMTGGAALNRKTTGRKGSPSLPTHQTTYSPSPKASADMGDYKENPDSREREGEKERHMDERKKGQSAASCLHPTGDLATSPPPAHQEQATQALSITDT
ncbi:uncharacterized protein WM277_025574 isoform 2-T2 [Molossus nigricans]